MHAHSCLVLSRKQNKLKQTVQNKLSLLVAESVPNTAYRQVGYLVYCIWLASQVDQMVVDSEYGHFREIT